jgi:hypothetical protein
MQPTKEQLYVYFSQLAKAAKEAADDYKRAISDELTEGYYTSGTDRKTIELDGRKIGVATLIIKDGGVHITDHSEFLHFAEAHGLARTTTKTVTEITLDDGWEKHFRYEDGVYVCDVVDPDTGEIQTVICPQLLMTAPHPEYVRLTVDRAFKERFSSAITESRLFGLLADKSVPVLSAFGGE